MIYIGIDTGTHTGFAVWDSTHRKFLRVDTLSIHEALFEVKALHEGGEPMMVIFEDARQRKWYGNDERKVRAKLKGAGSVERDCSIWDDFLTAYHISFRAVPPRKGMTKVSPTYFEQVTKWKGRTSEHARDAAMLVVGY